MREDRVSPFVNAVEPGSARIVSTSTVHMGASDESSVLHRSDDPLLTYSGVSSVVVRSQVLCINVLVSLMRRLQENKGVFPIGTIPRPDRRPYKRMFYPIASPTSGIPSRPSPLSPEHPR